MPCLLVFAPHPDDESYSSAATVATASRSGWSCRVICASDGEHGQRYDGGTDTPEDLRRTRRAELAAACELLGAGKPVFFSLPDGGIEDSNALRDLITRTIRELAPDAVVTLGADGAYGHPDHLALHLAVTAAWAALPDPPVLLYASFAPGLFASQWRLCVSMMGEPPSPPLSALGDVESHYELCARSLEPLKRAAMEAHRSQLPGGRAEALFPAGVVQSLLPVERFRDARGEVQELVRDWFANWQAVADGPNGG